MEPAPLSDDERVSGSRRRSWGAFALLAGLALASFWAWQGRRSVPEAAEGPTKLAPAFDPSGVQALVFEAPGASVRVERTREEWWVRTPIEDRASAHQVAEILRQTSLLATEEFLPAGDLARFGLAPPARRFVLELDGPDFSLALGDSAPVGSVVYAAVEGDPPKVFLLDQFSAGRYFTADWTSLRDPVALPLDVGPVDSIHVRTRALDTSLRAARLASDRWVALDPRDRPLDALVINRVLDRLRQPMLNGYPPEPVDREAFGLRPSRAEWVVFQRGLAETVRIGHASQGPPPVIHVVPAGRTAVATLPLQFYRDMVDGWPALADPRLLSLPADSILAVAFLEPAGRAEYRRDSSGWRRVGVSDSSSDAALARDIAALTSLRLRAPGARPSIVRGASVTLRVASSTRAETLSLAPWRDSLALSWSNRWPEAGPVAPAAWRIWTHRAGLDPAARR